MPASPSSPAMVAALAHMDAPTRAWLASRSSNATVREWVEEHDGELCALYGAAVVATVTSWYDDDQDVIVPQDGQERTACIIGGCNLALHGTLDDPALAEMHISRWPAAHAATQQVQILLGRDLTKEEARLIGDTIWAWDSVLTREQGHLLSVMLACRAAAADAQATTGSTDG